MTLTIDEVHAGDDASADAVAVPVFEGRVQADGAAATLDERYLEARGFDGKPGEVAALLADDGGVVLAVGVGPRDDVEEAVLRRAAAAAVRASGRASSLALDLLRAAPGVPRAAASQALAEGAALAGYAFDSHRSNPKPRPLSRVTVLGADADGVEAGLAVARAQALARDLANEPPAGKAPRHFAEVAERQATEAGLLVEVWDETRLAEEGCGGLLAVSRGSDEPARLVKLVYEPEPARRQARTLGLVGKGITFDSGGLSLKTADGMMTMKVDMSGAAAVLAAMCALPAVGAPVRVVGWCCLTENLPGPSAIKPGDVIRYRDGSTVEVLNTDAEGRLVLADGLLLAADEGVDAVVDVATLTGACSVALGREVAGLFASDDRLAELVGEAAARAGEPMWRLPLHRRYRRQLDSDVADIKNVAGGPSPGGAILAALFLEHFSKGVPWVHLDIAGTARADADDGEVSKGATGFSVRTLVELARNGQL